MTPPQQARAGATNWIVGKYGDLIPLLAFIAVIAAVYFYDHERIGDLEEDRRARAAAVERRASFIADQLGNAVNQRMGAMATGELQFTPVEDSVSQRTLAAALDTVTQRYVGLTAMSAVYPSGRISRSSGALIGTGSLQLNVDTALTNTLNRAQQTSRPAATGVLQANGVRRVIIFDPVVRSGRLLGYLAAELDPGAIYRSVVGQPEVSDSLTAGTPTYHAVYGPHQVLISNPLGAPRDWLTLQRPVRVADTDWQVQVAYPPVDTRVYRTEQMMRWAIGLLVAIFTALLFALARRTIMRQREEISLRQVAEEAARTSAAEARERAREARELAAQLEAAQHASQRLSTSLNPDDVVELFLGAVAEILDADVASLYTFEEEGEVVVGRRRIVFQNVGPVTARLQHEDIRQVRAPVSMLPAIAEAVASGEPYVDMGQMAGHGRPIPAVAGGAEAAAVSVTLPLQIGGHMVGVATWEIYGERKEINHAALAFAQALAAPSAAALRSAELFASLEEERARAAREALRFAAVLDQMADGVIVVDEHGRVERSNKTAVELLGPEIETLSLEEWAVRFAITNAEGRPLTGPEFPLVRALRGERLRRATYLVRSAWGTERYLSMSAGPILTAGGEEKGAAIVLRDVSDEHQYAEMLRHTNRELRRQAEIMEQVNTQLREATKAKDQFLAVMSHELRTPINAIMGYSDLLDLGVKGDLNPDQRAMISRIRDTSRHLLGLINEVLDLAKIGAGRIDLVMAELDVAEVVERAVQQVIPLANAKGLTLHVEEMPHGEVLVVADETRLTQIIINLLSNAVKFTVTGGVTIQAGVHDDKVEIHVLDSGPGIPEDQRDRIFEEFYQVEGGLARTSGGTGLGLSIARRFARLMGGDIVVHSQMGRGSEFVVTLPSARAEPAVQQPGASVVFLARSEQTIDSIAPVVSASLRLNATTDPSIAAAVTRREAPDLVVLDACAPDFSAWRALTSLQPDGVLEGTRVLLLAQPRESINAVELGEFSILTKPIFIERVAEAIARQAGSADSPLVLIADEDPHVRQIISEALTASGCRITQAAEGAEALRIAGMRKPDLMLISLTLRGSNGVTTLATARANPMLRSIPVIMLVPRELSGEQMAQLTEAVHGVLASGEIPIRSLLDLLRITPPRNTDDRNVATGD
ncbi:MAG TPA: ATP-binding protein [Longimicrobiales bacterium]